MNSSQAITEAIENADAYLNNVCLPNYSDVMAALEQIERLSREADPKLVDVPAMLGDIARSVIAKRSA